MGGAGCKGAAGSSRVTYPWVRVRLRGGADAPELLGALDRDARKQQPRYGFGDRWHGGPPLVRRSRCSRSGPKSQETPGDCW